MYKLYTEDILTWNYDRLFHACLCDPPYHLTSIVKRFGKEGSAPAQFGTDGVYSRHSGGFMNQQWDGGDVAFRPETWKAIGDYLLPGAYLLAFGGTRTQHRLICAIEDAGFMIFDLIAWIHGQGFPKNHNISKQIDRSNGVERDVVGTSNRGSGAQPNKLNNHARGDTGIGYADGSGKSFDITCPATDMAKIWNGYGNALKPAMEVIVVARKPVENTIASNCVQYGSGALNIDGCRVEVEDKENYDFNRRGFHERMGQSMDTRPYEGGWKPNVVQVGEIKGRWPANLIHDGSDEVLEGFPHSTSGAMKKPYKYTNNGFSLGAPTGSTKTICEASEGSAARFFYCAKASKRERDAGCEEMEESEQDHNRFDKCAKCGGYLLQNPDRPSACKCEEPERIHAKSRNSHPTVKPLALTEYLARLILPPVEYAPRRILVPFSGAGSEMIGAYQAGWDEIVGVELSEEYTKIAEARLKHWTSIPKQLKLE